MPPQIIAHRGFSAERPENTIASFDHALESGFPCIELDIHLTADGVPVVMHDDTVDRTTDGSGPISGFTLAEIKELDAGSWFELPTGHRMDRQTVPSLEDVLMRYAGKAHIFIEIKSSEKELIESTRRLLQDHGWLDDTPGPFDGIPSASMISFDHAQLSHSKSVLPELGHGYLMIQPQENALELCLQEGFQGMFLFLGALTPGVVQQAQRSGMFTGAFGASRPEDLQTAVDLGLSGVTVDWPSEAEGFLAGLP